LMLAHEATGDLAPLAEAEQALAEALQLTHSAGRRTQATSTPWATSSPTGTAGLAILTPLPQTTTTHMPIRTIPAQNATSTREQHPHGPRQRQTLG
jgi:hypothetical protein